MSKPIAKVVDLGFSVADGEHVKVSYENQTLQVSFRDWNEKTITFVCRETLAFRWQEAEYFLSDQERCDTVHEIIGSTWIKMHEDQRITWEGIIFHHYKLNFNAAGILEIICSRLELLNE